MVDIVSGQLCREWCCSESYRGAADADSCTNSYTYAYPDPNTYSHANPDTNTYSYANPDPNPDTETYSHPPPHPHSNAAAFVRANL